MKLDYFYIAKPVVIMQDELQSFVRYLTNCKNTIALNQLIYKQFDLPHVFNIESVMYKLYNVHTKNFFKDKNEHKVKFNISELATCSKLLKYFPIEKYGNELIVLEHRILNQLK